MTTITGTSGPDTLSGAEGDTVYGLGGDDHITGGTLEFGGAGNDTLTANPTSASYEFLDGGAGTNVLNGAGNAKAVAFYWDAAAGVHVDLSMQGVAQNTVGAGIDTLNGISIVVGSQFDDTLLGGPANEGFAGGPGNDTINGGGGQNLVDYSYDTIGGVTVDLAIAGPQNTGSWGSDTLTNIQDIGGTDFNDVLSGDNNNNVLIGQSGDDVLDGRGGDDVLKGGPGNDTATYWDAPSGVTVSLMLQGIAQDTHGAGHDTLTGIENVAGSAFNDTLEGDGGNNLLDGGAGIDTVSYADAAAGVTVSLAVTGPQVTGGAGTDTLLNFENLTGSSFNDVLTGDANANVIEGGAGNDTITGGAGADTIDGGGGNNTAVFSGSYASYTVKDAHGVFTITGPDGTDTVRNVQNFQFADQTVSASSFTPTPATDFAGDGHGDILWRNDNGDVYLWNTQSGGTSFTFQDLNVVPSSWHIQGIGDYNGDGKADLLWQNANGDVYLWGSQSGAGVNFQYQDLGVIPAAWHIQQSAADLNGDGKADILWRNDNGDTYLWASQPGSGVSFSYQDLGVIPTNWQIQQVTDFNGDGKADLLWRNSSNGDVYLWNSQSGPGVSFSSQDLGVVPATFQIKAAGDFNGDGKADIVWQGSNGDTWLWDSVSGPGVAFQSQHIGAIPTSYQIQAVGDYNGDGKADILWQGSGGDTYAWLAGGGGSSVSFASHKLLTVGASWHVQSDWHFS